MSFYYYLLGLAVGSTILFCIVIGANLFNSDSEKAKEEKDRLSKLDGLRDELLHLPQHTMSLEEWVALPHKDSLNLETVDIGTWFQFPPVKDLEHVLVAGQVVDACDALQAQCGGWALSMPTSPGTGERFVNKYRIVLVQ